MLWFNRVGIGLAILVTAGSGLILYEAHSEAITERAKVTQSNAEATARSNNCPQIKKAKPGADMSDQELLCALTSSGGAPETLSSVPTLQNAGQGWLSAMALVIGIWFVLWVFDFMAGGTERRAKSKSLA